MAIFYNYSRDQNEDDSYDEDDLPDRDETNPIPVIYTDKKGFVNFLEVSEEEAEAALRNFKPIHEDD